MQILWFDELWFRVYSQPYKGSVRSEGLGEFKRSYALDEFIGSSCISVGLI